MSFLIGAEAIRSASVLFFGVELFGQAQDQRDEAPHVGEGLMLTRHVNRRAGGHRRYSRQDVFWLRVCIKLRTCGMPLAEIRRYVELVREGTGNEQQRLDLLREQQRRVKHSLPNFKSA